MDEPLRHESHAVSHPRKLRKSNNISNDFESLFHEYWASIQRLLLRMVVDPAEAEDLALETFFRLYKYRPAADEQFNIGGWLHRVAANLALQSIRSFRRREQYELKAGKDALEESSENQPSEIFNEEENRSIARLALAQMNARQAELLVMRYSGMAYKDIAAALSLSPTSIGPLLLRAEREFEKRYHALTQEAER
jgi:RNA polymerase sigma-70 factor, ECF subfamily